MKNWIKNIKKGIDIKNKSCYYKIRRGKRGGFLRKKKLLKKASKKLGKK